MVFESKGYVVFAVMFARGNTALLVKNSLPRACKIAELGDAYVVQHGWICMCRVVFYVNCIIVLCSVVCVCVCVGVCVGGCCVRLFVVRVTL